MLPLMTFQNNNKEAMNIAGGQIRGAFFIVKSALFGIFRTLPSVSKITTGNCNVVVNPKKYRQPATGPLVLIHKQSFIHDLNTLIFPYQGHF